MERIFLVGVWLEGEEEKKLVGVFPQNGEKTKGETSMKKKIKNPYATCTWVCHKFFGVFFFFLFSFFFFLFSKSICFGFFFGFFFFLCTSHLCVCVFSSVFESFGLSSFKKKKKFKCKKIVLPFVLFDRDIIVNFFLIIFHLSTFPFSESNTYERKLNLFYSLTFFSQLSIFSIFNHSNQIDLNVY